MGNNRVDSFNVLLIGAGEINFGSIEGPWNHTKRLEQKLGPRLRVVGLVDIDTSKAISVLEDKRKMVNVGGYDDTKVFSSIQEAGTDLIDDLIPRLAILGIPPQFRGQLAQGKNAELALIKAFPSIALFCEKPVTTGQFDSIEEVVKVGNELKDRNDNGNGNIVGVGYMLRYLQACADIKQILRENDLTVMATNARYTMAYEYAQKLGWWDKSQSQGPIIEQATHFADLSRYFGGEINLSSVSAHTVGHDTKAGKLRMKRFDEGLIKEENRIPRVTVAIWSYESGAVGTLMHCVALHDTTYDTEIEIIADGYRLKLVDPYNSPVLYIRRPGLQGEEIRKYDSDDPFFTEISEMVDAVELGHTDRILSTFDDALKTYQFTWAIRKSGET